MSAEQPQGTSQQPRGFWTRTVFPVTVAVLFGVLIGLATFTSGCAGGMAYVGHDPQACPQGHAMKENYDSWQAGPHAHAATCQDCHSPHDNPVAWLVSEADNGFWHSLKFTTGLYPENIKIRDHNLEITEHACLKCHGQMTDAMRGTRAHAGSDQQISCTKCHANVGHMR